MHPPGLRHLFLTLLLACGLCACTGRTTLDPSGGGTGGDSGPVDGGSGSGTGGGTAGSGASSTGGTAGSGGSSSGGTTGGTGDVGDEDAGDGGSGGASGGTGGGTGTFPDPASDPDCKDEDGDGFYAGCGAGRDCHDGDEDINPAGEEVCGDRIDNDCTGGPDNGCDCLSESGTSKTRACYSGPAGTLGKGACRTGDQACSNGKWGECQAASLPSPEVCDGEDNDCDGKVDEGVSNKCGGCGEVAVEETCNDGLDNNCNGEVDEGCPCGPQMRCYAGPPQTRKTGACEDGYRTCAGESWGPCEGSVLPKAETCGDEVDNDCDGEVDEGCSCTKQPEICDGVDNNCNNEIDEGCTPCLRRRGGSKPWQVHKGQGPKCWPKKYSKHGQKEEYNHASIPSATDPGWMPEPNNTISFDARSTMCGKPGQPDKCPCLKGGDFTYFQTFFDVPSTLNIKSLKVRIENVDDGARITIFNSKHPNGVVDPGSYAYFPGGSTTDLAKYMAPGTNRIVITHVDDCCKIRRIAGVHVDLNDEEVTVCAQ